jgi:hypothetical protein
VAYDKAYYDANKERISAYNKARYAAKDWVRDERRGYIHAAQARRAWLIRLFRSGGCVDCGEQDHVVLEFDHVHGKKRNEVSQMSVKAASLNDLIKEVNKCEVRCANCHARATHRRRTGS